MWEERGEKVGVQEENEERSESRMRPKGIDIEDRMKEII